MIIKSIKFLSDYKQFKENSEFLFSSGENKNMPKAFFSILVGRNGSGKTTLMSLISSLFYNLERYNRKIVANFELRYVIKNKNITIVHLNNLIRVSVDGKFDNIQLVPKRSAVIFDYSMINKDEQYIKYDLFHEYVPESVILSTFSLHGEYPSSRRGNYMGNHIIEDKSITSIYGVNHWRLGSISNGIFRFIKLFIEIEDEITQLLKLFDLEFMGSVKCKNQGEDPKWIEVNPDWLDSDEYGRYYEYFNDIKFKKNGRILTLYNMSSGEKMLLLRSISILDSIKNNSIVIIEEPELHLDQVWNRQLISLFKILFKKYKCHIIIATHDYSLINSVSKDNLLFLVDGKSTEINGNTFLASYDELFSILYGDKFRRNEVENKFLESLSGKSVNQLNTDFEMLGNSIYKYFVYRELKRVK